MAVPHAFEWIWNESFLLSLFNVWHPLSFSCHILFVHSTTTRILCHLIFKDYIFKRGMSISRSITGLSFTFNRSMITTTTQSSRQSYISFYLCTSVPAIKAVSRPRFHDISLSAGRQWNTHSLSFESGIISPKAVQRPRPNSATASWTSVNSSGNG